MHTDLVVQRPDAAAQSPAELFLLFHGVGSDAEDMRSLAQALATRRPGAWVVSVCAPQPSSWGAGWQWFSVQGVTEQNRPERVAGALPAFRDRILAWQRETGVLPAQTRLIGFSQGAIMALAATQAEAPSVAGRVIAIAGRLAEPAVRAPEATSVHLIHGEHDGVMPVSLAADAHRQLQALGARVWLDRIEGLGHGIDARVLQAIAARLD